MFYLSPHTICKGRTTCRLIYFNETACRSLPYHLQYHHHLQDFALGKLDISPHHEKNKGGYLEHYKLTGPEEISRALKNWAIQLTNSQYRAILKKKKANV